MGKRELVALLNLSSWCLVVVERLFLAVPRGCLPFVIVVFPDHTHLLFLVDIAKRSCERIQRRLRSQFGHSLLLHPYYEYMCREGSGETAHICAGSPEPS